MNQARKLSYVLWLVAYEVSLAGEPYRRREISVVAISTDDAYAQAYEDLQEEQQAGEIHSFGLPISAAPVRTWT